MSKLWRRSWVGFYFWAHSNPCLLQNLLGTLRASRTLKVGWKPAMNLLGLPEPFLVLASLDSSLFSTLGSGRSNRPKQWWRAQVWHPQTPALSGSNLWSWSGYLTFINLGLLFSKMMLLMKRNNKKCLECSK